MAPANPGSDVFVLAGQSNMISRYGPIDGVIDATDADFMQWGYNAQTLTLAADPLDHDGETANTVGMWLAFAKAYKAAGLLAPGRKLLFVPVARGGTAISYWANGSAGDLAVTASVNAAMASGAGTNVLKGILWHQGESNTGTSKSAYAAALDALITDWRASFAGGNSNTPFVVGDLLHGGTSTDANIVAALAETPTRVAHTAFVSAASLASGGDSLHFSAAAQRTFGARYFTGYVNAVSGADITAPVITSSATPTVAENTISPTGTLTANETVTWTKTGGADAASFSLAGATWTLNATPDYETKSSYVVDFTATDTAGNATVQTMTLGITDMSEGGFTPNDLWLTSENGDWWDVSDRSKMYQDTAGTTPVTATSQRVRRWVGQRGNIVLTDTVGLELLNDGTDDYMYAGGSGVSAKLTVASVAQTGAAGEMTSFGAFHLPDTATRDLLNADDGASVRLANHIRINSGAINTLHWNTGGSVFTDATAGTISANTRFTTRTKHTATSVEAWLNNVSNGSTALTGTARSYSALLQLFFRSSTYYSGRLYKGFGVLGRATTSPEDASLESWLA